ncbi:RDD family protein [Planctomycetota bacterium]
MKKYTLQTPENVSFQFELAGVGRRLCALLLDLVLIMALICFVNIVIYFIIPIPVILGANAASALAILSIFFIVMGYYSWYEWKTGGQSFGKKILGIRVIRDIGVRITFYQVVIRNLFRFVDILPVMYVVGGICCFLHPLHKRLGDVIAGTVIIVERKPVLSAQVMKLQDRYNSLADDPNTVRRILSRITPPERELLVQSCMRRAELEDRTRLDLFENLAQLYKDHLDLEQAETMTDERLIQNIAAILVEKQVFQN